MSTNASGGAIDFSQFASPFPYEKLVPDALKQSPSSSQLEGATSHPGLIYRSVLGFRPLRLDLHRPINAAQPVPLVIYIHGGSFVGGIPEMGPWAELPQHGIAVAAVTYRLAGEAMFPAPVDDIRAAVSWLSENAAAWDLDTARFALWGSSAGAFLSGVSTLLDPALPVHAVVCHYPLTDCGTLVQDALPGGQESAERLATILDYFLPREDRSAAIADHIHELSRIPPFLIVHGTSDTRVGPRQAARLHQKLRSAGAMSRLELVEGGDHGSHHFFCEASTDQVVGFLQEAWGRT